VLTSIEFDDHPPLDTAEIDDEFVDRNLSAEFIAIELSILEDLPESLLSVSRIAAKRA